jgi:hypothetical protein
MDEREVEWLPPVPAEPSRPEQPAGGPQPHAGEPPTPPGYYYVPPGGYPPYPTTGLPGQDTRPSNGDAVAGFVLSCVSFSLLVFTAGLSSIVSLTCAILGVVYARKGKRRIEAGESRRNDALAQAGLIVGIVALVISVLATVAWTLIAIFGDFDEASNATALVLIS